MTLQMHNRDMNYRAVTRETQEMRSLAHELKANLERESVLHSAKRAPLQQRLGQVFEANQIWAKAEQEPQVGLLRARAQRDASTRIYLEDVELRVEANHLEMSFTRWVNDQECGQSYCGGTWRYRENLETGHYDCIKGQNTYNRNRRVFC
jgi:hypothetical protein